MDKLLLTFKLYSLMRNTFLPIVGIVVTISPNLSLYRIVVLPAASSPTMSILISFLPKRPLKRLANIFPILDGWFCFGLLKNKLSKQLNMYSQRKRVGKKYY
jgi:hypothetical protein